QLWPPAPALRDSQNHNRSPETRAPGAAQAATGWLDQTRDRRCGMKPTIEVTVSPQGDILIDAVGFKGADCEKATKYLEEALGVIVGRTRKADYYNRVTAQNEQKLGK